MGARFLVAALMLYPIAWFWGFKPFFAIWIAIALWPVAAFVTSGLGKLIGIALARRKLRRHLHAMELRLQGVTPSSLGEHANA